MKITFKSTITHQESEPNIIEFTSPVEISKQDNSFNVYEFIEPQNKIMNRIEVSENVVNIFAGTSTIILSLGEPIKNEYETPEGNILFDAELHKLENNDHTILMEYTLSQLNKSFGNFKIELKLSK